MFNQISERPVNQQNKRFNNQRQNNYKNNRFNQNKPFYNTKKDQKPNSEIINVLSNNNIKQIIINFIYQNLRPYSNFMNHELIEKTDLNNMTTDNYIIQYKYNGEPSFLLFYRNKDRYYSCIINKKYLLNDPKDIIIDSIHLIPFDITLELKIYEGSIFDGVYYSNKEKKINMFYVNDIFKFRGENKFRDNINNKFIELGIYLSHFKQNKIIISKHDKLQNINNFYNSTKSNNLISGICFYPFISGTSYVYSFKRKQAQQINKSKQPVIKSFVQHKQNKIYKLKTEILKSKEEIKFNFEVRNQTNNKSLFDIYINNEFVANLFLNLTAHKKLLDQIKGHETDKNYVSCCYDRINNRWKYLDKAENETDNEEIIKYFDIE